MASGSGTVTRARWCGGEKHEKLDTTVLTKLVCSHVKIY